MLSKDYRNIKVAVALSGGVDSSVTAALLKQEGYDVIGASMINQKLPENNTFDDAKKISELLEIPYYKYNFIADFSKEIINDYFCGEYLRGRTPNPCPLCNVTFKFGRLLNKIKEDHKIDYMATGHYAQVRYNKELSRYQILRGVDPKKDQSYMLYGLTQKHLKQAKFPLGEQTKEKTREIAEKFNLPVVNKKESQDICFNEGNTKQFLSKIFSDKTDTGKIIDTSGKVLGKHRGIAYYTIGQRKGIGIAAPYPLYVLDILAKENKIVVGAKEDLYGDKLIATDFNWVSIPQPEKPIEVHAKIRYRSSFAPATVIVVDDENIMVKFKEPQESIASGQSVVVYDGNMLLGGGIIQKKV